MTHQSTPASRIHWRMSNEVWYLLRAGRRLAILEPTWDGLGWFVFAVDADGEPVYVTSRRRIAALKTCMVLWARRKLSTSSPA